jgi:RimJ/RimL family protein N-acetyltransferase
MLNSEKIILRRLNDSDRSSLAQLANNKKIWDNLRDMMPYPYSEDNASFFINMTKEEDPQMTFAIEYNNQLCGVIGLVPLQDVYKRTVEIGYWIGEPFWNKGIATEAVRLVSNYAFEELGFIRIHTGIFEYNTSSMKVLEKCGYKKDGVFEKAVLKNGNIYDEHRFSKINDNDQK